MSCATANKPKEIFPSLLNSSPANALISTGKTLLLACFCYSDDTNTSANEGTDTSTNKGTNTSAESSTNNYWLTVNHY